MLAMPRLAASWISLLLFLPAAVSAQRAMTPVDLLNVPVLSDPRVSPDGRQLTAHATAVTNITWSPDSMVIYFIADDPKTPAQVAREKAKDDVRS